MTKVKVKAEKRACTGALLPLAKQGCCRRIRDKGGWHRTEVVVAFQAEQNRASVLAKAN